MNANVNLEAAIGVLAFLGSCLVLLIAGLFLIHALVRGKRTRARALVLVMFIWMAVYLGFMLAFSLASSEKALGYGEEKYFCEIDCHLAYSVFDVRKTKRIGQGTDAAAATGTFYLVTLKTRFDERTISSTRGDFPLTPNSRLLTVRDEQGREFGPSMEAERSLERSKESGTPLATPLRPGESYMTTIAFDLPADAANPTLLVNEGEWITHFIIGHENSPLHAKTTFQLEPLARRVQQGGQSFSVWSYTVLMASKADRLARRLVALRTHWHWPGFRRGLLRLAHYGKRLTAHER